MSTTVDKETCPACNGARIQVNKEGLRVLCPACGGRGTIPILNRDWWQPICETTSVSVPVRDYRAYQ